MIRRCDYCDYFCFSLRVYLWYISFFSLPSADIGLLLNFMILF